MISYILAGGESRRLGRNKALLKLQKQTLIERAIAAIPEGVTRKVVARSPDAYRFLGCPVIADIHQDCGPIGGVHAGLVDAGAEPGFFLACDLPFITVDLILQLIEEHTGQAIFGVEDREGNRPLCTIYSQRCLAFIENQIARRQFSLKMLATLVPSAFISLGEVSNFLNVNTEEEWRIAQLMAAKSK